MSDFHTLPNHGLGWLDASGDRAGVVLSTRIRLARNLQGHAFGPRARVNDREAVLEQTRKAMDKVELLSGSTLLELPDLDHRSR